MLEQAALYKQPLTVRWACLLHDLGKGLTPVDKLPQHIAHEQPLDGGDQVLCGGRRDPAVAGHVPLGAGARVGP
ncbi:HD domain-containing protein [Streptomyces sp. NPDC005568]|uniref:HD domain-containing protein n=1 Tax=Streptomyces sp. NPDC005568 TaxID=3156887 RepID=UPI0033BECA96